jgi:membrane protease YdiL (CAAX protease family)
MIRSDPARRWMLLAVPIGPLGVFFLWMLDAGGALAVPTAQASLRTAFLLLWAAPVLEELAFRGALRDLCRAAMGKLSWRDNSPLTLPNLLTSIAFAACHLAHQPPLLAASLLVPSLLLGRVREITHSLLPCILLHAWFNLCFLMVFTQWSA